jgi:hypothetical protein
MARTDWRKALDFLEARFSSREGLAFYLDAHPRTVRGWVEREYVPEPDMQEVIKARAAQLEHENKKGAAAAITAKQALEAAFRQETLEETRVMLRRGITRLDEDILPTFTSDDFE